MGINVKRLAGKVRSFRWIIKTTARPSFSQVGEDAILHYLFNSIGISRPSYLEIGTNHPVIGNNTYAFYLRGCRGVLVEPDPSLHSTIRKYRRNDKLLTCGIALEEAGEMPFYVYPPSHSGWNTFSAEEMETRKKAGVSYEKVLNVPLKNINTVIRENFSTCPDFVGIDVEGLDEEITRSIDFERYAPKVICIETLRFGDSQFYSKQQSIIDFLLSKGYILYADTFVNSIFCKQELINKV